MYLKQFDAVRLSALHDLLNKEVQAFLPGAGALDIAAIYKQFDLDWGDKSAGPSDLFHISDRLASCGHDLLGMDLPILVTRDDPRTSDPAQPSKNIVMVVGQDPLRHMRDFPAAEFGGRLIVGTPYALHSPRYRDRRTTLYCDIVKSILDSCDVYLTDVRKLGRRTVSRIGENYSSGAWRGDGPLDLSLLEYEFNSVAPRMVVLFGNTSVKAFRKIGDALMNTPGAAIFPHPRARNPAWEGLLRSESGQLVPCDDPHKVAYITAEIRRRLQPCADMD